jgi:hypothetical protein
MSNSSQVQSSGIISPGSDRGHYGLSRIVEPVWGRAPRVARRAWSSERTLLSRRAPLRPRHGISNFPKGRGVSRKSLMGVSDYQSETVIRGPDR